MKLGEGYDGFLAVTDGPNGVYWRDGGEVKHMAAFKVDAVDTLGAGDTFHGAFAVRLAETGDVVEVDALCRRRRRDQMHPLRRAERRRHARGGRCVFKARRATWARASGQYFFTGQGAPQGAQAPAKSSGDTARPLDGLVR